MPVLAATIRQVVKVKEFTFTMTGTIYAASKTEAEDLVQTVCDGVSVDKVKVARVKDEVATLAPLSKAIKQHGEKRRARSS